MNKTTRYSPEVREREVRMVFEHQAEYDSQWAALNSIAAKIGCTTETLRKWVRRAEMDQGLREGLTSSDRERLKALERENRELKRALSRLSEAPVTHTTTLWSIGRINAHFITRQRVIHG